MGYSDDPFVAFGLVLEWQAICNRVLGKEAADKVVEKAKPKAKAPVRAASSSRKRARAVEPVYEEEEEEKDATTAVAEFLKDYVDYQADRAGVELALSMGEASCEGGLMVMIYQKGTVIPCPGSWDSAPVFFDLPTNQNAALFEPLKALGSPFDTAPRWFGQSIRHG